MSRFISALALAAVAIAPFAASPALADPHHDHGRPGPVGHPGPMHGPAGHHDWRTGQRFDQRYAPGYAEVDYHRYHRLRPPPRGYHWVRSGNDAVLVAIGTGVIASVLAGALSN
jgi:Ni/Co efflux regulator RcnB